ncbi:MAG: tyrosine-type recombinase/integrase [Actinobacteria bacterium]|nr:tyrosine-type recombinase/integrase [Actinomycetota bacterium]
MIAGNILARLLKPAAKRAGVSWANLHTSRHTRITRLLESGWNPKQVQVFAGHHSPAFTLERYCHLMPDDLPEPPALPTIAATDGVTTGVTLGQPEASKDPEAQAVESSA